MRNARVLLAMAAAMALAASSANAALLPFAAVLDGPSEFPANASPGTGLAEVDLDTTANTMHVHVTFAGLTGTTTASHIHAPTVVALTGAAGVATTTPTFSGFPLGVTSGTYDITMDMTLASSYNPAYVTANGGTPASAEAALFASIESGHSYLNIHSSTFPGGEIRGFLVPEPASLSLVGCGGLLLLRRFRR
jgi:hypothetical protein